MLMLNLYRHVVRQPLGVMTPSALGDRHDAYYQLERASENAALLSSTHCQAGKGGPVASTGTLVALSGRVGVRRNCGPFGESRTAKRYHRHPSLVRGTRGQLLQRLPPTFPLPYFCPFLLQNRVSSWPLHWPYCWPTCMAI